MMKNLISFLSLILLLTACGSNETKSNPVTKSNDDGLKLMESKCYACHNPKTESPDVIIAPPMIAVKKHYLAEHESKEAFVKAVVDWAMNPEEENALMPGAINKYKIMPKQSFEKEELQKIAAYLFDNDIEKPKWFGQHEKEMHGDGGKGNNWKKAIALIDGKKWKVDAVTQKHIEQLQKTVSDNQAGGTSDDVEIYHKLGSLMSDEVGALLKDCTMEGADHDALHQFLMPLMKKMDKLKTTPTALIGKKVFGKIGDQLEEFGKYFEE